MAKKILVIDDEELILRTIDKYLKRNGYEVEIASGALAPLQISRQPAKNKFVTGLG